MWMTGNGWIGWLGGVIATLLGCQSLAQAACYGGTPATAQTRFVLEQGEARDTRSGLIWKRCSVGLTWDGTGCAGTLTPLTLDLALAEAGQTGGGWHVPNGAELQSLIDRDCGLPPVDPVVFPDIRPTVEGLAKYWTTSPVGHLGLTYTFDFMDGQADGNSRGIAFAVRLVRSAR